MYGWERCSHAQRFFFIIIFYFSIVSFQFLSLWDFSLLLLSRPKWLTRNFLNGGEPKLGDRFLCKGHSGAAFQGTSGGADFSGGAQLAVAVSLARVAGHGSTPV